MRFVPLFTIVVLICTVILQIATMQLNEASACIRTTKSVEACPIGTVAKLVMAVTGNTK